MIEKVPVAGSPSASGLGARDSPVEHEALVSSVAIATRRIMRGGLCIMGIRADGNGKSACLYGGR